ncbi:hypothetical protein BLJAPNOD_04718 [Ensifer sp. M14]|uniref:hypothetical protein n=1 Tax=Ensifer sp. M14 TaxID=2203782 RepID=UPI000E1C89CE|nr:hypothetical protein [Ensifer sp. M14]RDL48442.1 hypothetical protein BLJAPNOD_04718 [Ensifer sp. M14]
MNEGTFSLDFVLDSMRADEERGAYPQLAVHIELYEKLILEEGNDELKAAYLALKARIAAGFEYERKHGKWSLLKSDHPLTLKLRQVNSREYLRYQAALRRPAE